MSEIEGELARVSGAFDKPTLRLLERTWAPFVIAVFKSSFSRERDSIPADRLHTRVDALLAELQAVGEPTPPGNGRGLCVQWMNQQWLVRTMGEGREEEYALTSHALEAISLVDSLMRDRALISESRLKMILHTVRQWAAEANAGREDRIRRLDAQISELTAERDRLAGGGDIAAASDDRMLDGYFNLIDLISQLPGDFKRVKEAVTGMHRKIINDFREENRPVGEVLDEYLHKTDQLMSATSEGRAFEGALELLRDDGLLLDLKNDLQTILGHSFAAALTPAEQQEFRGTVTLIRRGIDDVLTRRIRLSTTLREHIENHDRIKERELEELLRAVTKELAAWMQYARPRTTVPVELMPETLDIVHLRERFHDPAAHIPPPPLQDMSNQAPAPPSLEELRTYGGPLLSKTRDAVTRHLTNAPDASLGQAFTAMGPDLRRPVEILGLMHLANRAGALDPQQPAETYDTLRPDGSQRTFEVPRVTFDETAAARFAALETGQDT